MRRRLILVLLVLLPFQFAWSAAAAYCGHETDPSANHFGHHVHVHKAASGSTDTAKHAAGVAAPDLDCPVCHLGAPALPAEVALIGASTASTHISAPEVPAPRSTIAEAPERPNWLLAA
jgi:hypothetical protein